jgi:O-antigen/teichoic acid export membrane protein
MLLRSILGFAPANILPALTTVAIIVVFTRVMPPDQFGWYAVAQATVLIAQALAFGGLQLAVTRYHAARQEAGELPALLATAYASFLVLAALVTVLAAGAILLLAPEPALAAVLWAALPLLLLRGLVALNQAVHRGALTIRRYNLVEAVQSLAGLAMALLLALALDLGAVGLVLGLAAGSLLAALGDAGLIARHLGWPDSACLREVRRYALPLMASYGLAALIVHVDRLFLERLAGPEATALYAVAFGIVDRPVTLVFMAVNLAAFPLAIDRLERQGVAAARAQLLRTATILLALAVPAVAGLACVARPLAAALVGEAYRPGVVALLPWLAGLALLRGMGTHYLDHAIHLAGRTGLFLWTLGPPAVASLLLNPLLIPAFGLAGALATAFVAQLAVLALTALIGRRVFPIGFPVAQAWRTGAAAAVMAAVLVATPVPPTALGLALAVPLGLLVYAAAALLLDAAHVRTTAAAWLRSRLASRRDPVALDSGLSNLLSLGKIR